MIAASTFWLTLGFIGQLCFSSRFIIQWLASEKAKKSIVPEAFWYFSLFGGIFLLIYAIHKQDPVFIVGQLSGLVVYCRNLYFLKQNNTHKNDDQCPA